MHSKMSDLMTMLTFVAVLLFRFALGQQAQIVSDQVILVGGNNLLSTPPPGISGFGDVQSFPREIPTAQIIHSSDDDSNVEIVAIERPVMYQKPTSPVQDLLFVDPIHGDIVSVPYDPNMYPVSAPVKYARTYRLSNARRFPMTYGRRRTPTFRNPAQNSYYSDDTFYNTLRSARRQRVQQIPKRRIPSLLPRRPLDHHTPTPRNEFWDRYLYMILSNK